MESRLRIAGQAVHPVLVMFPLGLFTMALLFDLGNLAGGPDILGQLAYWNIMGGLLGGVLVVLASAIDLIFVRNGHAKRVGRDLANAFGSPGYLRLSYALGDEDLATGVGRLQEFLGTAK